MSQRPDEIHLFEAFGVAVEYAVACADSLDVRPLADELIAEAAGDYAPAVARGPATWSRRIARHVIGIETSSPATEAAPVAEAFAESVGELNRLAEQRGARLVPGGMHPWMAPADEAVLWDRGDARLPAAVDRAFGARRHPWSNAHGATLSLPFAGDHEFARLLGAIRLVLPLVPALAASSPFRERRRRDSQSLRLRALQHRTPGLPGAGSLVPQFAASRAELEAETLAPIYEALAPVDPDGMLRHPSIDSRAAVAIGGVIQLRASDVQECPQADLAVAIAAMGATRALVEERRLDGARQQAWDTGRLESLLDETIDHGDQALLSDRDFLDAFGYPERGRCRARELWQHLFETDVAGQAGADAAGPVFELFIRRGNLANRLADAVARRSAGRIDGNDGDTLRDVYRDLADCLRDNRLFDDAPAPGSTESALLLPY